jgi:hypothetical protein
MTDLTAISTAPTDLVAFVVGWLAIVGLLALARYLPEVWVGGKGCACPAERRRSRARWPYVGYQPGCRR